MRRDIRFELEKIDDNEKEEMMTNSSKGNEDDIVVHDTLDLRRPSSLKKKMTTFMRSSLTRLSTRGPIK